VILERTSQYIFPVVTDMDFGHTSPYIVSEFTQQNRG
jgi:muramoyltetrapeptide carboxypeptidase LdcA involved in peptidoglycan recycling